MTSPGLILALGLLGLFFFQVLLGHKHPNLPPGPRPLPIVGNLFQLCKDPWRFVFPEWKQRYGPLTYFRVGGTGALVLNTQIAAAALLDKRSAIYSSRPRFIVASEYICGGLFSVLMPYTDLYRRMRKCAQEALMNRRNASGITRLVQERMATRLCLRLLSEADWEAECHGTFISVLTSFLYGESSLSQSASDELENVFDLLVPAITEAAAIGGSRWVEFFPWLRYLPFQWKSDAQKLEKRASAAFIAAYTACKASTHPSIGRNVAMMQERHSLSDRECGWLLANFFLAGADASDHTFRWFVLAMLLNPDVQEKCHAELDEVVGRSRLPGFGDWESLPYIRATLRELVRWRPVAVLGLPHASTQDDCYDGYFIPKGTTCIANIWSINHDTEVWGCDAEDFNPERFMTMDLPMHEDGHASFGFGRRICSGRYVANDHLFIMAVKVLWCFDILPPASGHLPNPDEFRDSGIVQGPAAFDCKFAPRSQGVSDVLRLACEQDSNLVNGAMDFIRPRLR